MEHNTTSVFRTNDVTVTKNATFLFLYLKFKTWIANSVGLNTLSLWPLSSYMLELPCISKPDSCPVYAKQLLLRTCRFLLKFVVKSFRHIWHWNLLISSFVSRYNKEKGIMTYGFGGAERNRRRRALRNTDRKNSNKSLSWERTAYSWV
jgi:hypothetical protein